MRITQSFNEMWLHSYQDTDVHAKNYQGVHLIFVHFILNYIELYLNVFLNFKEKNP